MVSYSLSYIYVLIRSQYQPLTLLQYVCSSGSVVYAKDSGVRDPGSTLVEAYFVFLFVIRSVQERDWSVQHADKAVVNCL